MALSNESVDQPSSGFADGVEFEETFPEPRAETATAPVRFPPAPVRDGAPATPRLTVVPDEPAAQKSEALFQEHLEKRLREAEAMVKQTIESVRLEEEKRLAEWVRTRRDEEERRLAKWADERRTSVERSMEQRSTSTDGVLRRVEEMLLEWQERFEERLDQRRRNDDLVAERLRVSDEERLRAWRSELERALDQRATQRQNIAAARSARDVGRILRDAIGELIPTSAFALAVHPDRGDEVAYRYRVASENEVGQLLRRDALDDGPDSAVAHIDTWVRAQRTVRAGARNVTVHTAQIAIRSADATVGVLTLQSEGGPIADSVLAMVADLAAAAAPRLSTLRDSGSLRGA